MPSSYIASQRSIHVGIIDDKRVNDLEDPWYITGHFRALLRMDNLGRLEADPSQLRAMLFPRNPKVTPRKCAAMAQALNDVGLFFLYSAPDGEQFLQSARPDRQKMVGSMQRKSALPPPDPQAFLSWLRDVRRDTRFQALSEAECYEHVTNLLLTGSEHGDNTLPPSSQHVSPEEKRNRIEREENEKGREIEREAEAKGPGDPTTPPGTTPSPLSLRPSLSDQEREAEFDHVVDSFHQLVKGNLTAQIATTIRRLLADLEPTTIIDAMKTGKAQLDRKPDWPYVKAIINNWLASAQSENATPGERKDYGPHCPFSVGLICASNCASPEHCRRPDHIKQGIIDEWNKRQADICPFCELPRDLCTCDTDNPQEDQAHAQQQQT